VQAQYLDDWTCKAEYNGMPINFPVFSLFVSRKNKQVGAKFALRVPAIGAALKAAGFTPSSHHAEKLRRRPHVG